MTPTPTARSGRTARPDRRRDVLALLRERARPMTIAEVAQRLAVHQNTVRFHLERLVADGQAEHTTERPATAGPGRPPRLYRATARMDPHGRRNYRVLALMLAEELAAAPDPVERATSAGRTWGERIAGSPAAPGGAGDRSGPVQRLLRLLDGLGFEPELTPTPGTSRAGIGLRACPFLEAAREHREVVCSAHLGLMQGALAHWDAPVTVDRLEPFVQPDLCLAHLTQEEPA